MKLEKPQSQYVKQPGDKITLAECQAMLNAGILQATLPIRVGARYAVIASGVSLLLSIVALIVSLWRT